MKKLYQYLEEIYLERYFDYTNFNVQNFINFVRANNVSKKKLSDDELKAGFLDLRNKEGKRIDNIISKETLDVLKKQISSYKDSEIPVSQKQKLAAMFFYTNNFPIIWNNYIEQKEQENKNFLNYFTKKQNKEINNIKVIYQKIFESILSTDEIRKELIIDEILKSEEKEIEKKVEEKIKKNNNQNNFLLDLFYSFKKKNIVDKIMTIKRKRMMRKKPIENTLMNEILNNINNDQKIDLQKIKEINKSMIKDSSNFYDKIYHAEMVFKPDNDIDSQKIVEELMNKIGYEVNHDKEFSEIKLN